MASPGGGQDLEIELPNCQGGISARGIAVGIVEP
jgi:hypothetical protein